MSTIYVLKGEEIEKIFSNPNINHYFYLEYDEFNIVLITVDGLCGLCSEKCPYLRHEVTSDVCLLFKDYMMGNRERIKQCVDVTDYIKES